MSTDEIIDYAGASDIKFLILTFGKEQVQHLVQSYVSKAGKQEFVLMGKFQRKVDIKEQKSIISKFQEIFTILRQEENKKYTPYIGAMLVLLCQEPDGKDRITLTKEGFDIVVNKSRFSGGKLKRTLNVDVIGKGYNTYSPTRQSSKTLDEEERMDSLYFKSLETYDALAFNKFDLDHLDFSKFYLYHWTTTMRRLKEEIKLSKLNELHNFMIDELEVISAAEEKQIKTEFDLKNWHDIKEKRRLKIPIDISDKLASMTRIQLEEEYKQTNTHAL